MTNHIIIRGFLVVICTLTLACNPFGDRSISAEKTIARVHNMYLYHNDIKGLVPPNTSTVDSIELVNYYVEGWIRRQLLLHKLEETENEAKMDVENKIQDYRESLLLFAFEQQLLKENLDSTVNESDIEQYYEKNKDSFVLKDNLLKASFVIADNEAPYAKQIKEWMLNKADSSQKKLKDYCFKYATNFALKAKWYTFNQFINEIPIDIDNAQAFLQNNTYYQTQDGVYTYWVNIQNYALKGQQAPLDYKKEDIIKIILNKRKLDYIKQVKNRIYDDALQNRYFEIFE